MNAKQFKEEPKVLLASNEIQLSSLITRQLDLKINFNFLLNELNAKQKF